jgi:hypothetical protein
MPRAGAVRHIKSRLMQCSTNPVSRALRRDKLPKGQNVEPVAFAGASSGPGGLEMRYIPESNDGQKGYRYETPAFTIPLTL